MAWETVATVEEEEEEVVPPNWTTVAQVDEEPEEEEGFSFSEDVVPDVYHALKGYGKMAAGIADLPNLISTISTYPHRKILNMFGVPEEYTDKAVVPSLSEQEFMQPVNEYLSNTPGVEEGDFADYAQTAVEWGGLGPVSAVRKGASAAPDIAMGIAAPVGEWIGDQFSEGAGTFGEIAGGLTGLAASLRKGKGFDDAVKTIKDAMWGDSDEVIERVSERVAASEKGTLADLSADEGVAGLETMTSSGPARQNYVETEIARQQQIADEIREPFGTADPTTARATGKAEIDRRKNEVIPKYVESRQNRVEIPLRAEQDVAKAANEIPQAAAVEAGLNKARAQERAGVAMGNTVEAAREADVARAAFGSDETLAQAGIRGSDAWKAEKAADKADNVQPKWDEFDAIESIDSTGYKATVEGFIDGLPESQKVQFKEMFSGLTRPFRNQKITEMKPKQIQNYIKDISRELTKPRSGQRSAAHDDLQKLYDELREQLGTDVPVFDDAMQAEAAWKKRFDADGVVDKASQLEPELFFKAAGESDEAGAVAARIIKDAEIPGMPVAQGLRLRSLARRSAKGVDDVFMAEYESVMDSLPPEIRNQAQRVVDTTKGLEAAGAAEEAATKTAAAATKQAEGATGVAEASEKATTGEVARLEKAIKEQRSDVAKTGTRLEKSVAKSNLNKYVNDRKGTIRSMLKNPDDVSDLVELQRNMERLGEIDSFNANMGDVILESLSDTKSGNAGLRMTRGQPMPLKADAIPKFETIAESLTQAGTDPAVIQKMRTDILKLATYQQKSVARDALLNREHVVQNIIESGASALGLKLAPGSSLVWSGTIRKAVRSLMGRGGSRDKAMMQAIDDFMLNPEKYLEAVLVADSPAKGQQLLMSKLVAASQAYAQD